MTLNVRLFCSPLVRARHLAALASLPMTYAVDADGPVDIALADETQVSIAAARACTPGALVIENAARLSKAQAQELTDNDMLAFPLLNLSVALSQLDPLSLPDSVVLVRSHLGWRDDPSGATIEHLAALSETLGALSDLQFADTKHGYAGRARTLGGVEVVLSGQTNAPVSRYELDVVGLESRLEVCADLENSGKPVSIRLGSGQGFHQPLGVFESPLRLFWRNLGRDRSRERSTITISRLLDAIALLG